MAFSQLDMESFLPSEIARLVYGYLEEEECSEAAQLFLETSVFLKECAAVAKKGRKFNTKIYGLSLVDLFDFLSELICLIKENGKFLKESNNISSRLLNLLQSDNGNSDVPHKENKIERKDETSIDKDNESVDLDQMKHFSNNSNRHDSSQRLIESENKEASCYSYGNQSSQICEKDGYSPHFINIKEENDMEDCTFEGDDDEMMASMEPEVQILSPDIQQTQDYQETVNLISNPTMIGKSPQLLCQPPQLLCQPAYGMVQMVPAYPTTAHPTALFMPQQNMANSQQPIALHQSQAISFQTNGTPVSSSNYSIPTMMSKPKVSTPVSQQADCEQSGAFGSARQRAVTIQRARLICGAQSMLMVTEDHHLISFVLLRAHSWPLHAPPTLKTYKRPAAHTQNKEKMKQNIYQSSCKLRPIAPKIEDPISITLSSTQKIASDAKVTKTHWRTFENGVKVQVLHQKDNTKNPAIPGLAPRRCLRSRRVRPKPEQTATPFFIDIQDICNEN